MADGFFSIDDLMDTQVEGSLATEMVNVPEGEWQAYIEKFEGRTVEVRRGNNPGPRPVIDITWKVTSPEVEEVCGRSGPTVRQSIWLDVTESGGLDMGSGKNVGLGRLREALGQNTPGSWSFNELIGCSGVVRVEHSRDESKDRTYANVTSVAAA